MRLLFGCWHMSMPYLQIMLTSHSWLGYPWPLCWFPCLWVDSATLHWLLLNSCLTLQSLHSVHLTSFLFLPLRGIPVTNVLSGLSFLVFLSADAHRKTNRMVKNTVLTWPQQPRALPNHCSSPNLSWKLHWHVVNMLTEDQNVVEFWRHCNLMRCKFRFSS